MVSNKSFICNTCGYSSKRKYNLELHQRNPKTCEKRLLRQHKLDTLDNVTPNVTIDPISVTPNVTICLENVTPNGNNVTPNVTINNESQLNIINYNHSLQCPFCKKTFANRSGKSRHVKAGKCVPCKDEKDKEIEELKQQLEESEAKRKEAEKSKTTVNNNYNITNNNNYFDHSTNYNNYDNLNLEHVRKEDIKRLFDNCRMQYPELSEDLTRMILSPKENQCIYLPEGQKSNTCAVMKDGTEMRKPLIRVLMDLGVQTAILIRDANVIERNKKDIVNNQFWADNRNACGLNISDIDYMTDTDKEIVQRNKNIVLDMCDGKI